MGKGFTFSARDTGDVGSVPGLGGFPGGSGNTSQYSCLKNPMDRRARRATVHGAVKSQTWPSVTMVWQSDTLRRKSNVWHIVKKKSSHKTRWLMQCGVYVAGRRNPTAFTSSFLFARRRWKRNCSRLSSCSRVTISPKNRSRANT